MPYAAPGSSNGAEVAPFFWGGVLMVYQGVSRWWRATRQTTLGWVVLCWH